jgi:MFS family permease
MIFFTLFCTYLTNFLSNFKLILIGSGFGIISLVPLIFSDDYKSFCLFVTAASIGESILTPRLLDYTYFVAKKKQEGVYLAVASLPYYFSMILTGAFSGFMMEKFCGSKDEEECRGLWKYSLGAGISAFVILAGLAKWIRFEDDSRKYIEISEENVKDPDVRLETS